MRIGEIERTGDRELPVYTPAEPESEPEPEPETETETEKD